MDVVVKMPNIMRFHGDILVNGKPTHSKVEVTNAWFAQRENFAQPSNSTGKSLNDGRR